MVNNELEKDPDHASLPSAERSASKLVLYHKIRTESWAIESDEVKAEVQQVYDQERQEKPDASDEEGEQEEEEEEEEDADEKSSLQRQQE